MCCTVVTHVVIHSRFVLQPQKSDGDQVKCQCEEPLAGPLWKNAEIESGLPGSSVSDYVQVGVFTSAKSTLYVEILEQGRKQTSRIPGVKLRVSDMTLCSSAAVLRIFAQSGEKWQSPMTVLMLSRLQSGSGSGPVV